MHYTQSISILFKIIQSNAVTHILPNINVNFLIRSGDIFSNLRLHYTQHVTKLKGFINILFSVKKKILNMWTKT